MLDIEAGPVTVEPGSYEPQRHFYPRVPNARLHPMVRVFLSLGNERIAERYRHLHPEVERDAVVAALGTPPQHFRWAGADLFSVTTEQGVRRMVLIETNSSPSGQKSMPLRDDTEEQGGYRELLSRTFLPMIAARRVPEGDLAVLWDKNPMENGAYAAVLADLTGEPVHAVPCHADDPDSPLRVDDGVVSVRVDGTWRPVRACFRYVTQRPWSRLPPITRTAMLNPVLACLAGGRNKLMAAKAYDLQNASLASSGLRIRVPETIWDVTHHEIPLWVRRMGGVAVVKVPYANAGQGVYTITNADELEAFMEEAQRYERFIVQGLIGNVGWSSRTRGGRLYHVGTLPDRRSRMFVADLRFMVGSDESGFYPVALYARRARSPLPETLEPDQSSWDVLGTNLSVKTDAGWTTETERLMLMDDRDFSRLGLGIDDLIEAYVQTVLATTAIDQLAQTLLTRRGTFRRRLFGSLNPDPVLLAEVME